MSDNDQQYFLRRADEQAALSERATHGAAKAAHQQLAAAYRERAEPAKS